MNKKNDSYSDLEMARRLSKQLSAISGQKIEENTEQEYAYASFEIENLIHLILANSLKIVRSLQYQTKGNLKYIQYLYLMNIVTGQNFGKRLLFGQGT